MDRWTALSMLLVSLGVLACDAAGAPPAQAQAPVDTVAATSRAASMQAGATPAAAASAPARSIYSIVPD